MSKIVTVISGNGGEGKTSAAANIATGLGMKKKVLVIDMNFGIRQMDLPLAMDNMIIYHMMDVMEGRCELAAALIASRKISGLYMLSAPLTKTLDNINIDSFYNMLSKCNGFDYIIIDLPARSGKILNDICRISDDIITVFIPDVCGVRGADKIIGYLDREAKDRTSLLINKLHPSFVKAGAQLDIESIRDVLPQKIIGIIPFHTEIYLDMAKNELPVNNSSSKLGRLYLEICERLEGKELPLGGYLKAVKSRVI